MDLSAVGRFAGLRGRPRVLGLLHRWPNELRPQPNLLEAKRRPVIVNVPPEYLRLGIFFLAVDRSSLPFQHAERCFEVKSIGTVSSPYLTKFMTPKQATVMNNGTLQIGKLRLFEQYRDCLHDLDGFDYCW